MSSFVPNRSDLKTTNTIATSALGKAYIEFEMVTSAFACYNLLNKKQFMEAPIEINFYPKDQYLTKTLI